MTQLQPDSYSDNDLIQWQALSSDNRVSIMSQWIKNQTDPHQLADWLRATPLEDKGVLQTVVQQVINELQYPSPRSRKTHLINIDYLIALERAGFSALETLNCNQIKDLVNHYLSGKRLKIIEICRISDCKMHYRILNQLVQESMEYPRWHTLWKMLNWEQIIKHHGQDVIRCLSQLGRNHYPKQWDVFKQTVAHLPEGKKLAQRVINFPQKQDWDEKIYLCAAGLEIWGRECIVPSRQAVLSQMFAQAFKNTSPGYIHAPPSELVEYVSAFLQRSCLQETVTSIASSVDPAPKTRKI